MTIVSYILVFVGGCYGGYHWRELKETLRLLQETVKRTKEPILKEEPKSIFIDPDDPIAMAKFESEENFKRLNSHLYEDDK